MPVESSHGRGATRNPTPTRFNLKERVAEGEAECAEDEAGRSDPELE